MLKCASIIIYKTFTVRIVIPERQTTRQDRDSKLKILNILFLTTVSLAVENQMVRSTRVDEFFSPQIGILESKGKICHKSVEYILFNFILKAA